MSQNIVRNREGRKIPSKQYQTFSIYICYFLIGFRICSFRFQTTVQITTSSDLYSTISVSVMLVSLMKLANTCSIKRFWTFNSLIKRRLWASCMFYVDPLHVSSNLCIRGGEAEVNMSHWAPIAVIFTPKFQNNISGFLL